MRRLGVVLFFVICVLALSVPIVAQTGANLCDISTSVDTVLSDGQTALLSGEYETALEVFTCAVQINKDSVAGYVGRADAYAGLERYPEARADLLSVLAISRDSQMTTMAESTPDPNGEQATGDGLDGLPVDEAPIIERLTQIEAEMMPLPQDGYASSPNSQFTVNFPFEELIDITQPAAVENITLVNDTAIFASGAMSLDNRDLLISLDLGDPQTIAGMAIDSSLLQVAEGLRRINGTEATPLTRISTTNFTGYTFTVMQNGNTFQRVLTFDVDPSDAGVLILNINAFTASEDDLDANLALVLAVADSFMLDPFLLTQVDTGSGTDGAGGAFVNSGDGFTLALPAGWRGESVTENGRGAIVVTTGGAYVPDSVPVAGAPFAIVNYGSASELLNVSLGGLDPENTPIQVIEAITGVAQGVRAVPFEGFNAALSFTSDGTSDTFIFAVMLDDDFYVLARMLTATGTDGDFFDAMMNTIVGASFSN
ncbi:MAG: tetratricopeptide repeat protein [Aggregatilineales bacterium]